MNDQNPRRRLSTITSVSVVVGQLVLLYIVHLPPMIEAALFLSGVGVLAFVIFPSRHLVVDVALICATASPGLYIAFNYESVVNNAAIASGMSFYVVVILIVTLLEAGRRAMGYAMSVLCLVIIGIVLGGYYGGLNWVPSASPGRLLATLGLTDLGIYGSALKVALKWIFVFLLYGQALVMLGAIDLFSSLSLRLVGRYKAGSAYSSVVASAAFGTLSGSNVANVMATGRFTIPLMIRAGYPRPTAAAIESVASTGGALMPPVMAAGAFLIAEYTSTSYAAVLAAAIIPALLYYLSLMVYVWGFSSKSELHPVELPEDQKTEVENSAGKTVFVVISLAWLIYRVLDRYPLEFAAAEATVIALVGALLVNRQEFRPGRLGGHFREVGTSLVHVSIACALAGVIVGTLFLTGAGVQLAALIAAAGSSSALWGALLTMLVVIILGMGIPGVAAYIVAASLLGGALVALGFDVLGTHLFIYYFSLFAGLTPPVAITAFAAASIVGENPNKVGYAAFKMALPAFGLAYFFLYNNELLGQGAVPQIILATGTAVVGMAALALALAGWCIRRLSMWERLVLASLGLVLAGTNAGVTAVATAILVALVSYIAVSSRKNRKQSLETASDLPRHGRSANRESTSTTTKG